MAKEGVKVGKTFEVPLDASEKEAASTSGSTKKTKTVVRGKGTPRGPALKKFEDTIERIYTQELYAQCRQGAERKERFAEKEIGVFGIGTDWKKVDEIRKEPVPSCEELKRLGVIKR